MWTRKELKEKGKAAFKANYWRCVLVALILVLISGGLSGVSGFHSSRQMNPQQNQTVVLETADGEELVLSGEDMENLWDAIRPLVPVIVTVAFGITAVGFVLAILVFNPLQVGCQRFFTENSRAPAELGEMGFGFGRGGYGRTVKTMLLMDVFLLLWSLLFIIPGIIKSYSYRMVPYILAQEPELSGRAAIDRSRQMMNGQKWRAFVLDLSFILWILLTIVTLGIVGIFYVQPYIYATNAELYHALKKGPQYASPEL